jgi:hypothetical protein
MVQRKLNRKSKLSGSKKSKNIKRVIQSGGNAPACLSGYVGGLSSSCGTASMHNVNPQAGLDNVVNPYGSTIPLGQNLVGGGSCGDEGSGTNNMKSSTFKQYLDGVSKSLDVTAGKLSGGGYTVDTSQYVGGLPVIGGYDDCCPPAIVGGKIISSGPDQPVCGPGAIRGGGRKNSTRSKKKKSKRNKNSTRSKKKKSKRNKNSTRSKKRFVMHLGGGDFNGMRSSKPAMYNDAFNGEPSLFEYPADMSKRDFGATQPNYGPNAL